MNAIELISQDLFDKVRSRFSNLEMGDENGNVTSDPRQARFFDFNFTVEGSNIGRVSISINERGSLKVFYSQGILEDTESFVKDKWFDFLREMRNFSKRRLLRFDTRDITKSNLDKTDFQYLAKTGSKEETMSESKMFGSSKSSYLPLEKTRLIIRHNKAVDETQRGARSRNINALYVENAEGERFKYPFIHLAGAKAMQRHVANGGRPYDECGQAIIKMSEQIAQLNAFKRHVGHHDSMHTEANEIMERACMKLESLRGQVHALSKQSHYESWKESYAPMGDEMVMDQATMEDYKAKFTVSTFQEDLTQYFPLLYSIMKETGEVDLEEYVGEGKEEEYCDSCDRPADDCECDETEVKEFAQYENWVNTVVEGRLTDDEIANLKDLLSTELTLGVDGVNAIESLQGIGIDDEELADALAELAKVNPEADPKPTIGAWLEKFDPEAAHALGLEHEEATPENPEADADAYADADAAAYGQMESMPKNTDIADKREKLAKAGATTREIPKGTDYADKKEKLAKASNYGKKGPFHNIGKGLKAFVTGKEEPIDETQGVSMLEIAEMVKSFYDRETKKFPLGKTGVVTKVRKELGDHAAALAERLVNHLEVETYDVTGAGSDMAVEPNDSISPVHGEDTREVEAFEDIMRLAGLKK